MVMHKSSGKLYTGSNDSTLRVWDLAVNNDFFYLFIFVLNFFFLRRLEWLKNLAIKLVKSLVWEKLEVNYLLDGNKSTFFFSSFL